MRTRERILRRDGGLCCACKARDLFVQAEEVDHITPLDQGGDNNDANLQSLCVPCHRAKTAAEDAQRRGIDAPVGELSSAPQSGSSAPSQISGPTPLKTALGPTRAFFGLAFAFVDPTEQKGDPE